MLSFIVYTYSCSGASFLGPYGGTGGNSFTETPDNCRAEVKRIVIYRKSVIDSIQITYKMSTGQEIEGQKHGGYGGDRVVIDINVDQGERIIAIWGRAETKVDQLGFATNHGRIFGPYGGNGGDYFKAERCHLHGIAGKSKTLLDSLGFYCGRV